MEGTLFPQLFNVATATIIPTALLVLLKKQLKQQPAETKSQS